MTNQSTDKQFSAELKAKWIAALRSGEYPQGKHNLYNDGAFCCLGVLGCIAGIERSVMAGYTTLGHVDIRLARSLENGGGLRVTQRALEGMNDGYGDFTRTYSFDEIADWIERNIIAFDDVGAQFANFRSASLTALENVNGR